MQNSALNVKNDALKSLAGTTAEAEQIEPVTGAAGCSIAGNVIVQLHRLGPLVAQAQVEHLHQQ
jgi:hypothetical protein